ncbi:MAG: HesA/MoeB/ThiF family protein [Candidatus Thorarchaeota archaeon]|nr:HesA/MoeB/ThiF family protein [Candidatus Thorarchaeota archaeon]
MSIYRGMTLTKNQRERYSRMLALRDFSENDMESIIKTTVAVVGAGGLGSPALRLLTAIGFGTIRIIDRDVVELSNIQRQTVYNTEDIGKPKAEIAATNLAAMNPEVKFEPRVISIGEGNASDLLRGSDIILDGLDSFRTRRAVNRASLELDIPYIFAGAIEHYANLSTFIPGQTGCLQCVMGNADDNPENTCARVGVSPVLLHLASSIEVNEAILLATGHQTQLANRLMTIDSSFLSFDFFDVGKVSDCPVCSKPVGTVEEEQQDLVITHLCSESYNISPHTILSIDLKQISTKLKKSYSHKLAKRYLIVEKPSGEKITLMPTGSAIIKGASTPESAIQFYEEILGQPD